MNTTQIIDTLKMPDGSRRTFHVDVVLNGDSHRAYTVITLDPLRAENVLRNKFRGDLNVATFQIAMIREVIPMWNVGESAPGVTVKVPGWFQHRV